MRGEESAPEITVATLEIAREPETYILILKVGG